MPVIAIDRALDDEVFASVISEDLEGAYELTQSLLRKPLTSIGIIGAVKDLGVSVEREQGFFSALRANANELKVLTAYGDHFSQQEGFRIVKDWIDQDMMPDAILATSYTLFEGILDGLLTQPELLTKTQLATFGDNRLLDFLPNKIQSLPQQFELIAENALELALNAVAGRYRTGVEVVSRKIKRR